MNLEQKLTQTTKGRAMFPKRFLRSLGFLLWRLRCNDSETKVTTMKNTLLALLGCILLSTPLAATAQQFGDFTYSSDGSAITITGYTGPGGAVTIPATIVGLPVTTIGDSVEWRLVKAAIQLVLA